jgi:FkbH-like protein
MRRSPDFIALAGELWDKFGGSGIVSVVAGEIRGDELVVELWVMSCRVLKRRMEDAMMDALASACAMRGLKRIVGRYIPTPKNSMVKDFYPSMGFRGVSEDSSGSSVWAMDVEGYEPKRPPIEIMRD